MRSASLRIIALTIFAVSCAAASRTAAQEPAPPAPAPAPPLAEEGQARIAGKVLGKDGKTPVAGAVVRASHLRTGDTIASPPSDARGAFALTRIPSGYVDLTVETQDGGFVASRVLNVVPESNVSVTLVLMRNEEMPQDWWAGRQPRMVPGTDTPAVGVANIRDSGGRFFRGPKGIALLAGAGALAILALSGGSDGESPASPATP